MIELKLKIKTNLGEEKIINFEIIQADDKFVEIEIKSNEVIIFKIDKLLIDINDNISLLYTMPINHDRI